MSTPWVSFTIPLRNRKEVRVHIYKTKRGMRHAARIASRAAGGPIVKEATCLAFHLGWKEQRSILFFARAHFGAGTAAHELFHTVRCLYPGRHTEEFLATVTEKLHLYFWTKFYQLAPAWRKK